MLMKRGGGLGRYIVKLTRFGLFIKKEKIPMVHLFSKNLLKTCFMADIVLSEETRKNRDGPYPQGAHSLLSYLSDSPTRL